MWHVMPLSAAPGKPTGFGFCAPTSCCSRQELKYHLEARPGDQRLARAGSRSHKALAQSREDPPHVRVLPLSLPAPAPAMRPHGAHVRGSRGHSHPQLLEQNRHS